MKKLTFLFFAFALSASLKAQTYTPVAVTGYNADVVAEGTGAAITLTNNDVDGAGNSFMAAGYTNPANATTTRGLPAVGLINSAVATTPGLIFELAPFTGNNALRINGAGTGTLTIPTPVAAATVYFLATSGSGTSFATITVTFTDNSTQLVNQTINDWFGGTGFAIQGLGRVNRNTSAIDNNATDPRLYQYALTISPFLAAKPIKSLTFSNTGKVLNVMGITLATPAAPLVYATVPVTGYTDDVVANLPGPANQSANNDMDGGAIGNRFSFVTQNYRNPANQAPTSYLPATGLINSAATPGLSFQLGDYNASNTLRIKGIGGGTLTFVTPRAARVLYLLGGAGNAIPDDCFFNAVVTFTDGTTQIFNSLSYADWFGMGDIVALQGVSRVNFDNNAIQSSSTDPSLYQKPLVILPANYGKLIQAVSIEKTPTQILGTLNILAISAGSGCATVPAGGKATASVSTICAPGAVTLSVTGADTAPEITYQWEVSTDNGATWTNIPGAATTTLIVAVTQTSLYRAKVLCGSQAGNSIPDTVNLLVPAPSVQYPDSVFCQVGKSTPPQFSPAGGKFAGEEGLVIDSNTGIIDLVASAPGKHLIRYTTSGLCPVTDSTTVRIEATPKPFFPNIITPDGDKLNDRFLVALPAVSEFRLRMFNRWGNLIWETSDPGKGWEGKQTGIYYYHMAFKDCVGNKQAYKGYVEVVN